MADVAAAAETRALERIARAALMQIDVLESGRNTWPPAELGNLASTCLELLLKAISAELKAVEKAPTLPEAARQTLVVFRERMASFERASVDARLHLGELTGDWKCPKCRSDVAAAAAIAGLDEHGARVEVVCKACGARSGLTRRGEETFRRLFGHLVSAAWNPAANGFLWTPR